MKTAIIVLALLTVSVQGKWPHLRTTWAPVPGLGGFNPEPRTQVELDAEGWVKLSSCSDGDPNFPGDRYARSRADNDIVLVFDGNGFIAGIQTIVPMDKALNDEYHQYSTDKFYQIGDFFGAKAYFATTYFVDPSIICNGGRTQSEFEDQGTGNLVAIQTGPTIADLHYPPLTEDDAMTSDMWYEHKCFFNMGVHYFTFNYNPDQPCTEVVPYQLVYIDGKLNGIVFQHIAKLDSSRFESVNALAINGIVDTPPTCLLDLTETPGVSTMHVYVGDYIIVC